MAAVTTVPAQAAEVQVTIENLAPATGNFLTPFWVGFHDGTFDLYDVGAAASAELERVAEDGNTAPLADGFLASGARRVSFCNVVGDFGYATQWGVQYNPFEAGYDRFIDLERDFIGRDALLKIRNDGPERQRGIDLFVLLHKQQGEEQAGARTDGRQERPQHKRADPAP